MLCFPHQVGENAALTATALRTTVANQTTALLLVTADGHDSCPLSNATCGLMALELAYFLKDRLNATSALAFDQGGSTTMYVASVKENGRNGIVTENGSGGHGPGPFGPAVAARAVQNGLFVAYNPPPAA